MPAVVSLAITAALAATWGVFAWLAAMAWKERCLASEKKRSRAVSKGNRKRPELKRARERAEAEAKRADEPPLPFDGDAPV